VRLNSPRFTPTSLINGVNSWVEVVGIEPVRGSRHPEIP
jgi:hypothetical protein